MNLQDEAALHTIRVISSSDVKKIENMGGGCLLYFRKLLFVLSVKHIKKYKSSKLFVIFHNSPNLGSIPNWAGLDPTFLRRSRTRFKTSTAILPFLKSAPALFYCISKHCPVCFFPDSNLNSRPMGLSQEMFLALRVSVFAETLPTVVRPCRTQRRKRFRYVRHGQTTVG